MNTLPLTDGQERLWRFVGSCRVSPTFREIRIALGINSSSRVKQLLDGLSERGYIRRIPNRSRAIVAVTPQFAVEQALAPYPDAILIAELERRTTVALAKPQMPLKPLVRRTIPEDHSFEKSYGPYDDWRTKAREATDRLSEAIKRAGLHP